MLERYSRSINLVVKTDSDRSIAERGKAFTGVLASEPPTSVTLKREKGVSERVLRTATDVIKASGVSQMPSNLHKQISPTAIADHLASIRDPYGSR